MAQRRMIHSKVSESNEFYKLSHSAQALYLHLNQNADDEGVVNNSETIMSALKIKKSTLNELFEKNFVIPIESKDILVIKHWYLGNTIQRDRFAVSTYHEDIIQYLEVGNDKVYRLKDGYKMETKCIQNGNKMYTQYSIVKNSIDKISIEELSINKTNNINNILEKNNKNNCDDLLDSYSYMIPDQWTAFYCSLALKLKASKKPLTEEQLKFVEAFDKALTLKKED